MIDNLMGGLKLAKYIFSLISDPEGAVIKIIDDINNTNSDELSEIKTSLSKKVNCDDILIEPKEDGLSLKFIGMKDSVDVFAINIAGFIYKLVGKIKPVVSFMVPKEEIEKIMTGLTVINDETNHSTFIEVPHKDKVLSLEVKNIGDDTATIDIPIESERILEKLREMKEE